MPQTLGALTSRLSLALGDTQHCLLVQYLEKGILPQQLELVSAQGGVWEQRVLGSDLCAPRPVGCIPSCPGLFTGCVGFLPVPGPLPGPENRGGRGGPIPTGWSR